MLISSEIWYHCNSVDSIRDSVSKEFLEYKYRDVDRMSKAQIEEILEANEVSTPIESSE